MQTYRRYKLERNARRRAAQLQDEHPLTNRFIDPGDPRSFYYAVVPAPDRSFRWAVAVMRPDGSIRAYCS